MRRGDEGTGREQHAVRELELNGPEQERVPHGAGRRAHEIAPERQGERQGEERKREPRAALVDRQYRRCRVRDQQQGGEQRTRSSGAEGHDEGAPAGVRVVCAVAMIVDDEQGGGERAHRNGGEDRAAATDPVWT